MPELILELPWTALAGLVGAALAGWAAAWLLLRVLARLLRAAQHGLGAHLRRDLARPLALLGPTLGVRAALPAAGATLEEAVGRVLAQAVTIVLIVSSAWALIALTSVVEAWLNVHFTVDVQDNLRARRIHTKFAVLRRSAIAAISVLAVGGVLFSLPGVRGLGAGILASAGVAGLAVGLAARPLIETLLAGLQLALTEPINLDDVVIVEGEWGRIEEIRATYVVVRIWDKRRLVVPVQWFLSQPFQNWTRVSADLLAAVTVEVDYRTPVEAVRQAAGEIVASSDRWDREFWNLQVVEAGERSLRLRVLMSAPDSGAAWDLRCEVREKLLAWLQQHHPECLPRLRVEPADPARLDAAATS